MPLSTKPTNGPSLPAGVKKVTIKDVDTTATSSAKEDVTDLDSTEREYADPVLKEGGGSTTATKTCSANGNLKGAEFDPDPITVTTGWVLEDCEFTYEEGKYATWSADWSYYPPPAP
jgi:hypothetical protein